MDKLKENLVLQLCKTARTLDNIQRSALMFNIKPQNVAQHSFQVAFLAVLAASDLKNSEIAFDELKLIKGALLHDVEEGMTGDMPYPIKNWNRKMAETYAETTQEVWNTVRNLPDPTNVYRVVDDLFICEGKCLEARVIKLCDMLEFLITMYQEIKMGNTTDNIMYSYGVAARSTIRAIGRFNEEGIAFPSLLAIYDEVSCYDHH